MSTTIPDAAVVAALNVWFDNRREERPYYPKIIEDMRGAIAAALDVMRVAGGGE